MATKRERTDLSLEQKYEIIQLLDNKVSQSEFARRYGVSQPTVSGIAKKSEDITRQYESNANPTRKRQRTGKATDIEAALAEWFNEARQRDIPLAGPLLCEKAEDLAKQLGVADFHASNGWFCRWKERHGIVFERMHGEKKDADQPAADHWVTNVLPGLREAYADEDIYNADETAFYYRALPEGSLTFKSDSVAGSKKSKFRVTVLVATNMTGTDKLPLMMIGKSKDPRCFRGLKGKKSLPVDYRNNSKAWMTSDIFVKWLEDINKKMKTQRRKILMLVDNCAAHPQRCLTMFSHVRVSFLPPNTTSVIQPIDQGIIRNLKVMYRKQVIQKIITEIDGRQVQASELSKKMTLLDAAHMISRAWKQVTPTTIQNCFRKAGFMNTSDTDNDEITETAPTDDDASDSPPPGMTVEQFATYVAIDSDLESHGHRSDEEICESVRGTEEQLDLADEEDADEHEPVQLPVTAREIRSILPTVRRFLEETNCPTFDAYYELEAQVEHGCRTLQRQCKMTEFVIWVP